MSLPPPRWLSDAQQRTWRAFLQARMQLWQQLDAELQHEAGLPYYQMLAMLLYLHARRPAHPGARVPG